MKLGRLFGARKGSLPKVPPDSLIYAVGDIHGRSDLLRGLVWKIFEDAERRLVGGKAPTMIFLGDYVDRGPNSKGVLDFLCDGLPSDWQYRFLKGNHEEALLKFLQNPEFGNVWREYGGIETLASYGVTFQRDGAEIDWAATRDSFVESLSVAHEDFLRRLSLWEQVGDYVFVHAGVRPGIPLAYQSEQDLLWIRDDFFNGRRALSQSVVVHGHTPSQTVTCGDGRIGIDTGAYMTGKLTAIGLSDSDVWYLST